MTSSALSTKTPVPQNGEPRAKPHSAVENAGSMLAQLEDADGGVESLKRDGVADVAAGGAR